MAEEEAFKVVDRRGRSGGDAPAEPAAPARGSGGPAAPSSSPPIGAPPAMGGPSPGAHDLQALFSMLASSALVCLGAEVDPATGEAQVDLEQARELIDLLLLLRDKTEGNRTEPESTFLEQILYDLQIRFVQASR